MCSGAGASTGTRPKGRGNSRIHEDKIRVCVRKRPLSKKEGKSGEGDLVQTVSTTTLLVSEPKQAVDLTAYTLQVRKLKKIMIYLIQNILDFT